MRYNRHGQIALDDRGAAVCGWLDDVTVGPYQRDIGGDVWRMVTRVNGLEWPVPHISGGCNAVASGSGQWMRRLDGASPVLTGSQPWAPSSGRVGDIDDRIAVVLDNEMITMSVYASGIYVQDIRRGTPFGGVRVKGAIASWLEFPGPTVKACDVLRGHDIAVETLGPAQYTPIVFSHASGLWALYQTDALGGVLHRIHDTSKGYRWGTKQRIFDPDVLVIGGVGLAIGWSVDEGQFMQQELAIDVLGEGMVSLLPDEGQPIPVPIPPIPPTPKPEPEPMKLHKDVMAAIRAYASVIAIPRGAAGEIEDQCREWTKGLCETVKALFPGGFPGVGGEWGWKRASATRPLSKETIALKVGAALHGWDLLIGVSTGRPKLSDDPAYHDLVAEGDQVFVPVEPIDRLVPAPASGHAPLDVPMWGISAFDLGCRVAGGDVSFLDEVVVPSGLTPRIVVASVYRTPRTQAQGRAQMPALFAALWARGLKCVVTLLTDTKQHGTTRAEALDHIREMNQIMVVKADSILAVRIGNENSHSVEADYMTDPAFLREAAALIDRRFPLSFGAGHGGEPVLSGGSFASHHSNRGETPEVNAAMMADAQKAIGVPVVDEEPLGIAEPERVAGRQRTSDVDWARRQAQAAKDAGLGGSTFHCDAGISCQMSEWGDTQAAALAAFVAVVGGPVVPVPIVDPLPTLKAEAIESAIVTAYLELLGRKPDDFGRLFYGDRLRDGRMTVAAMEADIKASREYVELHSGGA